MAVTKSAALDYHSQGRPGKLKIVATKSLQTQTDLSLAYSPGVAYPVLEIADRPEDAYEYTAKGNLVAVISNGTAILGLGNRGAQAAKPVMEGKAVLFKRFADVDVFDIEINSVDPEEIVRFVEMISPTFGGINLEDIKAPECFYIEREAQRRCDIPVFHDDQHGTAIISGAGLINALELVEKDISQVKIVINGAGAAGIAVADLYVALGARRENIVMCDTRGVIYAGRTEGMNEYKAHYAADTSARTLDEAMAGADVFIGLSAPNTLSKDMVRSMSRDPIIFAMANPDPEITDEDVQDARGDVIFGTGRSDYPNQVNNVLGFPFIFRGALDVRARAINMEMKMAATRAWQPLPKKTYPIRCCALWARCSALQPRLYHPQTARPRAYAAGSRRRTGCYGERRRTPQHRPGCLHGFARCSYGPERAGHARWNRKPSRRRSGWYLPKGASQDHPRRLRPRLRRHRSSHPAGTA